MFRTTTFLAVFVALIASAQRLAHDVTCANYAAATYCDSINAVGHDLRHWQRHVPSCFG